MGISTVAAASVLRGCIPATALADAWGAATPFVADWDAGPLRASRFTAIGLSHPIPYKYIVQIKRAGWCIDYLGSV